MKFLLKNILEYGEVTEHSQRNWHWNINVMSICRVKILKLKLEKPTYSFSYMYFSIIVINTHFRNWQAFWKTIKEKVRKVINRSKQLYKIQKVAVGISTLFLKFELEKLKLVTLKKPCNYFKDFGLVIVRVYLQTGCLLISSIH